MTAARLTLSAMLASGSALAGVILLLFVHHGVAAAMSGGVSIAMFAVGMVASRRADVSELEAIAAKNESRFEAAARSLGRSSGGWNAARRREPPKE